MNRNDLDSLIGRSGSSESDYTPVACLLSSGYGCVGYFNGAINENLHDTLVLLNMRLVDLRGEESHSRRSRVADFNDFLEEVVARHVSADAEIGDADEPRESTIPLTAIPLHQIALLYPVAHIATLLKSAKKVRSADQPLHAAEEVTSFLDFNNKSIVLKVLRTKLW